MFLYLLQDSPPLLRALDRAWLTDLVDFLHEGLPRLIFILLYTWALIFVVNFVTRRVTKLAESHNPEGSARASQVRTLASVVRASGIGVVSFLALLQVMESVLHFNLTPLLASAGVAGVAVGLAAQTIVKDVLNGILILVEDQYNVGDAVTLAGMTGFVDSMSLRKTTLRGFDGTLYIIPNSQITNVANQSRDFTVTTVNISVDFSASPNQVIPLLKKIVDEVRNEPQFKDVFLDEPKILGVDTIKGSEVIYPIQIRTRARQQFDAVREMQRRIRLALEEHRILPGSPYRVLSQGGKAATPLAADEAKPAEAPDPTTAPPAETNPFIGQS